MRHAMLESVIHWLEIAYMAILCLYQEVRGEEPDCPKCWKCEMMRVIVLCVGAFFLVHLIKWVF